MKISSLAPPDEKTEFLHSILYFGVWKNSVFISQSISLRAIHLEQYFNWLLTECNLIKDGDFINLCDHPPLELQSEITSTKGIILSAPVSFQAGQAKDSSEFVTLQPDNIGWEWLKKVLSDELSLPKEVKSDEVLLNSALEVKLLLSWSRLKSDDSTALLDRISNQLRHIETELDYTIMTSLRKYHKG